MPGSDATPLELALVRHALELFEILDDLPEEQIELGTAVRLQEDIAHLVNSLGPEDRAQFFTIGEQLAREADPLHAARIRNSMGELR